MSNMPPTGDGDLDNTAASQTSSERRGFFVPLPASRWATGLLALIIVCGAILVALLWPRSPGGSSVEAGFLRDMYTHHAQAVSMAMIIRDRTDHEGLSTIATEIALGQQSQMGTFLGLMQAWDIPQGTTDLPMSWMGQPTSGLMPGMATLEEIDDLTTLPLEEAEVLFLQLMIRHHQGGVIMAEAYLDRGNNEHVKLIAERIVTFQTIEIDEMNRQLELRGQDPITDPLDHDH